MLLYRRRLRASATSWCPASYRTGRWADTRPASALSSLAAVSESRLYPSIGLVHGMHNAGDALGKVDPTWANYGDISTSSEMTRKRMSLFRREATIPLSRKSIVRRARIAIPAPIAALLGMSRLRPSPTGRKPPLIHPLEDRTLTVAEAKALQGLPKDFRVCGTLGQKQQQIGNCVPVAIGRYIKSCLLRMLEGGLKAQFAWKAEESAPLRVALLCFMRIGCRLAMK